MRPHEAGRAGRLRPRAAVTLPARNLSLPCDIVVVAIGTRANPLLTATCPDLKLNKWATSSPDDAGMTSLPGVFAGGDIVRGAATVILAMGDGKRTARAMDDISRRTDVARTRRLQPDNLKHVQKNRGDVKLSLLGFSFLRDRKYPVQFGDNFRSIFSLARAGQEW